MSYGVDVHPYYQRGYGFDGPTPTFAWVKCSDGSRPYRGVYEGVSWPPDALVNRAKSKGIPVGGYHYAQPVSRAGLDFVGQTRVLLGEIQRLGALDVVPALDIEDDAKQHIWSPAEAREFCSVFVNQCRVFNIPAALYMNDAMAAKVGRAFLDSLGDVVLWIARYGAKPVNTRFDVHQYSSTNPSLDKNESYNNKHLTTGGGSAPGADSTEQEEAHMITLAKSDTDVTVPLALPGLPCRIVITPGLTKDGDIAEVFTKGIDLIAGYSDTSGAPIELGTLMPDAVDENGVGHIDRPVYFGLLGGESDAIGGMFTYSSTEPFSLAVYRVLA